MQSGDEWQNVNLENFLSHLKLRGIPIGISEFQRLRSVLISMPSLSHIELRDLLCSLLAKDDEQRRIIRRSFEHFLPIDEYSVHEKIITDSAAQQEIPTIHTVVPFVTSNRKPPKVHNIWRWGIGTLIVLSLILGVVAWQQWRETNIEMEPMILNKQPIGLPSETISTGLHLVDKIDLWVPNVEIEYISPWRRLIWPLLLFLSSGIGLFWLLHHAMQRIQVRERKPPDISQGSGRFFSPPMLQKTDYHLLSGQARREMCWGVGHYLSDLPLHKLDVPRTVTATASSGLPTIRFLSANREREVWLWQDSGSDNPDLGLLAEEITKALQEVSIFVQRGYFHGLPMEVRNTQGEVIWSYN